MPRSKQTEDAKDRKKSKKILEEDDDEIEDEIIESSHKKSTHAKKNKKEKKTTKKQDKPKPDEDELSDLEAVDEEAPVKAARHDEAMTDRRNFNQSTRRVIDPESPIGTLKTEEILSYLIQIGQDNLNPQLKRGAIDLLNDLTGRRRPYPNYNHRPMYGSAMRGGYVPRGRGHNFNQQARGPRMPQQNSGEADIYGEVNE